MKKVIGHIKGQDGSRMAIIYNGKNSEMTAEYLNGYSEEIGYSPCNLEDAKRAARIMWGGQPVWDYAEGDTNMKKALTAYEDTNMDGGAHVTNIDTARRAAEEDRDLIIHGQHYDGQRYHSYKLRITDLSITPCGVIGITERGDLWEATAELCDYARTGKI